MILTIHSAFFLGIVAGAAVTTLAGLIYGTSLAKQEDVKVKEAMKNVELLGSVKYRFTKVNEITEAQLNLINQAERPSASASHSKHKNDIVGQIKALEEEKIEIFRSILKDGVDPKLSIMTDGKMQSIRMSEAVAMHDGTQTYPVSNTEPSKPHKNGLRLVTTSEDVNESSNPEVPSPRS